MRLKFCCEGREVASWVGMAAEATSSSTELQVPCSEYIEDDGGWEQGHKLICILSKAQITHSCSLTFKCS